MTRKEHEDIEGFAVAAMIGLLAGGSALPAGEVAGRAFDAAQAFQAEKMKRIGETPPYDM